jgi:hypothetical protein
MEWLENMTIQLIRSILAVSSAITSTVQDHTAPILVEKQRE